MVGRAFEHVGFVVLNGILGRSRWFWFWRKEKEKKMSVFFFFFSSLKRLGFLVFWESFCLNH